MRRSRFSGALGFSHFSKSIPSLFHFSYCTVVVEMQLWLLPLFSRYTSLKTVPALYGLYNIFIAFVAFAYSITLAKFMHFLNMFCLRLQVILLYNKINFDDYIEKMCFMLGSNIFTLMGASRRCENVTGFCLSSCEPNPEMNEMFCT